MPCRPPLAGKTVIITRTRGQSPALVGPLTDLGAHVLAAPTIQVLEPEDCSPLDEALGRVQSYDWLVFTSANGVDAAAQRLGGAGRQLAGQATGDLAGVRIAAVGSATAAALQARLGRQADLVPPRAVAAALAEELIRQHGIHGQRILLLRADIARAELPERLRQAGASVTDVAAYRTQPVEAWPAPAWAALRQGAGDWITFTSASTVRNLVQLLGDEQHLLKQVRIASIGPITSAAVRELGFDVAAEAEPCDIAGLIDALVAAAQG